ncbi:regulatory protein RecX [Aeromicrobium phragmitis]|uniref:Regulatory protein RecX n=1 Tax=Aeromicrobium phragmitis TaxID=2478914 RepID=A0A3L8PQW6_9ACTN|nr:regulatory protein RecX [Aeromicrobium phragmitis]RLV57033.1 regulatory protein RecX [Aeromicrobium phragmitis]
MAPRTAEGLSGLALEEFARTVALDRLTDRDRSRADLAQAMAKKAVPDEVAAAVLDRLEAAGLVDDERFARSWVQSRQRVKGLAAPVLAMELRRQGIDDELARRVLDEETDADAEREAAHRLVQRKLRSVRGLDPSVQVRRLTGMLARKGYAPQVAFDVVRAELDADVELAD